MLLLSFFMVQTDEAEGAVSEGVYIGNEPNHHVDLHFKEEGRDQSLSIRLPGGGEIIRPSLSIGTIPEEKGPGAVFVDIGLDNRFEWQFGGGREGRFGEQIAFTDGSSYLTKVGDGSKQPFSFYLPSGAEIKKASINVSSPPSPEAEDSKKLFLPDQNDFDLDAIDTADIDGDGNLEVIYHDKSTRKVFVSGITSEGTPFKSVLLTDTGSPVHLRATGKDGDRPSIIVVSRPSGTNGQEVMAFVGSNVSKMRSTLLSEGLEPGSSGFSLVPGKGSGSGVIVINGTDGGVMEYRLERDGNLYGSCLSDRTINASSITSTDLDGDGDRDMILFPSRSSNDNITVLESAGPTYVSIDTGLPYWSSNIGASVDINENGKEEIVIGTGAGSHPAIFKMRDNGLSVKWIGFNYTRSSPRIINSGYRTIDGRTDKIKDVLYLTTFNGLYHLTQGSDVKEDIIWRKSRSFDALPLAPSSIDPGHMISLRMDLAFVQHSIKWSTANRINLLGPSEDSTLNVEIPFRSDQRTDISPLIMGESGLPMTANPFRTYLERYDMVFSGSSNLIRIDDLSVSYNIDLDISGSPLMAGALDNAMQQLTGDWIPFSVGVTDAGNVRVGPARVEYDEPPIIEASLPSKIIALEDSGEIIQFNIRDHISDDYLLPQGLDVELIMMGDGPEDIIFTDHSGNVITRAYEYPDYFGRSQFFFRVSDLRSTTISGPLTLIIAPQQDRPLVVGDPGPIVMEEGETLKIQLQGDGGVFFDPDGDALEFALEVVEKYPVGILETCSILIENKELVIRTSIHGTGGELKIILHAKDPASTWDQTTRTIVALRIKDVDSPPLLGDNPGRVYLLEDQSTPSRIPLEGWLMDPDTEYGEYDLIFHTSSPYIEVFSSSYKGEEYLFITPTNDLVGDHYVLVEMTDGQRSVMDKLELFIEPVNDIPSIEFNSKELLEGRGWLITGQVNDPDSQRGTVEFRIGDGPWRQAWGFKSWSMVIDFKDAGEANTVFVFFRANDGHESSPTEYIKLERPVNVPEPKIPREDVENEGDDQPRLDDPSRGDEDIVPPPSGEEPPWLMLGGTLGMIVAIIIFFGWTEIGVIIVATVGSSIYSKLSRKDILNHEIRGLIRGYIIANPGDHYSSIKRNLDLNNGTLAYHLRVLEQNGFVKSMYDGIYKRYYPSNVNISKLKKNVSKQEEIFNIILENPGITMEHIGRMIGVSRQVVNYHVKNLIRAGVVDYMRDKKSAKFYPSDNGSDILEQQT
ncbi:MAG: winged helix-turn-helix transcriptional regulator [Thermoplasmatota archaeon]